MSGPDGRKQKKRAAVQVEMALPPSAEIVEVPLELQWWQRTPVVATLAAIAVLATALAIAAQVEARRERAIAAERTAAAERLTLRAPTQMRALRITPNPRSWSASPDASLAWPEPPELLELYLPVGYTGYAAFEIVVDKVDVGRVLVLTRVAPDSNRELRLSLNSSAFGPGEYRLTLRGYTWRGERVAAGWVRLEVTE